MDRTDACLFVTLTYREFAADPRAWKRDLDTWLKALVRKFPGCCGLWRLEFQQRGAPHYHLLVWGPESDTEMQEWAQKTWGRITGDRSVAHLKYGVQVETVKNFRKCAFYLSIYQGKDNQDREDIDTGRLWGVWNRGGLETGAIQEKDFTSGQLLRLRRIIRRHYRATHRKAWRKSVYEKNLRKRGTGYSVFLPFSETFRLLRYVENVESSALDGGRESGRGQSPIVL